MPRLSVSLGGLNLYIKRDDCTGLATGGNKTRKLEVLMADALAQGADVVIESPMSPAIIRTFALSDGLIEREVATTA